MMITSKNLSPVPSSQQPPLTRIVPWSQQLATEVLDPGDLAVDLTAGKGRDTLALARAVGPTGQVLAFDIQRAALDQAAAFLAEHDVLTLRWTMGQGAPEGPGVFLVEACHSSLASLLTRAPKAVMANLGYLPGGDQALITRPKTTLDALHQVLARLLPGGRLAVTVYPSHPGGTEEGAAVADLLENLPRETWQVLRLTVANRPESPYLLIAEAKA